MKHARIIYCFPVVTLFSNTKNFSANERFVLQYICNYLRERVRLCHVFERDNVGLINFTKYLLYHMYIDNAQTLKLMLAAFMVGQIYERTDTGINGELHPYDAV